MNSIAVATTSTSVRAVVAVTYTITLPSTTRGWIAGNGSAKTATFDVSFLRNDQKKEAEGDNSDRQIEG
jgi:hypothetical protein